MGIIASTAHAEIQRFRSKSRLSLHLRLAQNDRTHAIQMKTLRSPIPHPGSRRGAMLLFTLLGGSLLPSSAHASLFHGETLDAIANGISWVVLVIAPIIGIAVFWLLHVMPEKIAEKKKHPQTTRSIACACSRFVFGGLLWPIAWLWAYTKPVLHKMAYGTDVDESLGHHGERR